MIRTFIVDDSATVRQVIGDILDRAPGIRVIGAAQDPLFALKRMEKEWPDVIILDVEMPRMDGLTFLKKIMSERPTPVVMCSTLTDSGSVTSVQALKLGAVEVVAKPKMNLKESLTDSSRHLIDAVRAAAGANMDLVRSQAAMIKKPNPKLTADAILPGARPSLPIASSSRMVAIGTSTGGTQALESVLTRLPRTAPAIAVVQHMPEKFTRAFADRLNRICEVDVKEAEDNDVMRPGQVLIAPGGRHLLIRRRGSQILAQIKDGPPVSRHRPSVDVLFRSAAAAAGKHALGIIMTGMGDDGAAGLKEMHDLGAYTVAQSEETCVVFGMPAVAIERGAVDLVVALDAIAQKIVDFGQKPNLALKSAQS
jgi:two-component system, chemotaxis family, protein-glutamate methylesterase/glutaminase